MDRDFPRTVTLEKRKEEKRAQWSSAVHATLHVHNREEGSALSTAVEAKVECMRAHSKIAAVVRDMHAYAVLDVLAGERKFTS